MTSFDSEKENPSIVGESSTYEAIFGKKRKGFRRRFRYFIEIIRLKSNNILKYSHHGLREIKERREKEKEKEKEKGRESCRPG